MVVPLGEPAGEAALRGAELALGGELALLRVDDASPDFVAGVEGRPEVLGAVVHVTRAAAEKAATAWQAAEVPVVVAAPGEFTGLARVVPPIDESARCATALVGRDPFWVRTDGVSAGMRAAKALIEASPGRTFGMATVDPGDLGREASRLSGRRARTLVWTGDPELGGNFLRVWRGLGATAPFVGIGSYDARFLASAGGAAEGALVTSESRPARDRAVVDRYRAAYGEDPLASAIDAYDAASLLVAAWRAAAAAGPVTRDAIRRELPRAVAVGASGSTYLDEQGVARPVLCASFRVEGGKFVLERIASEADGM